MQGQLGRRPKSGTVDRRIAAHGIYAHEIALRDLVEDLLGVALRRHGEIGREQLWLLDQPHKLTRRST